MHPLIRLTSVITIDAILGIIAFFTAFYLRLENFPNSPIIIIILVLLTTSFSFTILGVYKRIWRYSSTEDLFVIAKASILSVLLTSFILFFMIRLEGIPRSTMVIFFILLTLFTGGIRISYRLLRDKTLSPIKNINERIKVILIGAGDEAESFIRSSHKPNGPYHIIGIFDNDKGKWGRKIRDVNVIGPLEYINKKKYIELLKLKNITKIIITEPDASRSTIEFLLKFSDKYGISLSRLPRIYELNSSLSKDQNKIRPIDIEDLLGRAETRFDKTNLKKLINNKVILITGAGGTIGSELSEQISEMYPKKIILTDYSEYALWNINDKISSKLKIFDVVPLLLDTRDINSVDKIFKEHKPEIILHTAALKHVPICENHPLEAIKTNIIGTKIIANKAQKYAANIMVLISTDKAVYPSNFMGASKRAAEILIQGLDRMKSNTKFVTVRFGNVLGSTGSVIPLFQNQIIRKGPITITHKDATRFFMSVREAVELVLISLTLNTTKDKGGINVLKMGEAMKIDNLAKQLIRLSGLTPGKDIKIEYTGLRVGEKIHESLFHDDEEKIKTDHPDILIAKSREIPFKETINLIDNIEKFIIDNNYSQAISELRKLVPEFKIDPNNNLS